MREVGIAYGLFGLVFIGGTLLGCWYLGLFRDR